MAPSGPPMYPPFPCDVPTAQLSKVSLRKLQSDDRAESDALYESCKTSGFFLLDLTATPQGEDLLQDVVKAFDVAEALFDLEVNEKTEYAMKPGKVYGYKAQGLSKVDDKGTPDRCEVWGLSKDDIIGNTDEAGPVSIPDALAAHHALLERLVRGAHAICLLILSKIEAHLRLEPGKLTSLHRLTKTSADQLRLLKMPPQSQDDRRTSLLAHTDVGSVTLLWNILGGLQILSPGNDDGTNENNSTAWEFVQPQAGCAVVNMGDAMVHFTEGVVRSNLHRVTYAPGEQAVMDRYSIAYFSRPEDDVVLEGLRSERANGLGGKGQQKMTVKEWVAMKAAMYLKGESRMKSSGGSI